MTEIIANVDTATEANMLSPVSALKQAIDARLIEIHREPIGQHERICAALEIGASAIRAKVQV